MRQYWRTMKDERCGPLKQSVPNFTSVACDLNIDRRKVKQIIDHEAA